METLLSYLGENYEHCPYNVLLDSHFQMLDGATTSNLLTVANDGGLYDAHWDEQEGLMVDGKRHNPVNVAIETTSENGYIWVRMGESDQWQQVKFFGVSNEVISWLMKTYPLATELCASREGAVLQDVGLCPQVRVLRPPPSDKKPHTAPQKLASTAVPAARAEPVAQAEPAAKTEPAAKAKPSKSRSYKAVWLLLGTITVACLCGLAWYILSKRRALQLTVLSDVAAAQSIAAAPAATAATPIAQVMPSRTVPQWEDGPWIAL
jgi:hypothetical protein